MMNEKRPNHRPPKEKAIEADDLQKDFYTIYEVADLMQLHHNTVRKMVKAGQIPAKQYGRQWRIRKTDLEQFTEPEGGK